MGPAGASWEGKTMVKIVRLPLRIVVSLTLVVKVIVRR